MKISRGFMYIARRACGKVSATSWDDAGEEKENAEHIVEWVKRGDKVERIEIFEGDPMPECICRTGCRDCVTTNDEFYAGLLAALDVIYLHDADPRATLAVSLVATTRAAELLSFAERDEYGNLSKLRLTVGAATDA
jgi:hypothetical protein